MQVHFHLSQSQLHEIAYTEMYIHFCMWVSSRDYTRDRSVLRCVAVCCSVLQCVAVCCSALHYWGSALANIYEAHNLVSLDINPHIHTCTYTLCIHTRTQAQAQHKHRHRHRHGQLHRPVSVVNPNCPCNETDTTRCATVAGRGSQDCGSVGVVHRTALLCAVESPDVSAVWLCGGNKCVRVYVQEWK